MALFTRNFICSGFGLSSYVRFVPAPLMRKSFILDGLPENAKLTFSGLGYYRLFVNGEEITRGHLSPYTSDADKLVYFDVYDITGKLIPGENVIGFILGAGMRNPLGNLHFCESRFVGEPCAAFVLELQNRDGSVNRIEADKSVRCHASPIIFNDLRLGEAYDARLEKETDGWPRPGFDDSGWSVAVRCDMPRGDHRISSAPPIRVRKTLRAVNITKAPDGFIYDFGQNGAGLIHLHPSFESGRRLTVTFSEVLKNGDLFNSNLRILSDSTGCPYRSQTVDYICGGGREDYRPSFTYEGFRYAKITGISGEEATEDLLTFELLCTDMDERGTFSSSDPVLNELQRITREATYSNAFHIPTDCPHREKQGWTADAALSSVHMLLNLDADEFLTEWMRNVALAQNAEGAMPGTVPSATDWGYDSWNGPAWDAVLTEIPYRLWEMRGDIRAANAVSSAVFRYVPYILSRRDARGLVAIGLGDWVAPHGTVKAPLELTDTVMCFDICRKAAILYRVLGKIEMSDFCLTVARSFRRAIRENLIDRDTLIAAGRCQTSQAMCIYYDIFSDEEKPRAYERLVEIIKDDGEFIDCGVLGVRVLFRVLSENGDADLAYRMMTRPEAPSYGNMVARGDTTLAEDFNSETEGINSRNHHFLGDISAWFISYICGIRVNPRADALLSDISYGFEPSVFSGGHDNIDIRPVIPSALSFAEASYKAPGGTVRVRHERSDDGKCIKTTVAVSGCLSGEIIPPNGYRYDGCGSYPLTEGVNTYEAFRV